MSEQEYIQQAIANNELYAIGGNVPADWKEAYEVYQNLAKQGDVKAQFNLGYLYYKGDAMEQDLGMAYEWYQKAADGGDPRAHYNLSFMYERGEHIPPNSIKAKEHMEQAIALGDERANLRANLANAKEALKQGDREKAKNLFASISSSSKEAEMGLIACNVDIKCGFSTHIEYSYHSSGSEANKKFWKWGEGVGTDLNLLITNSSLQSWTTLVKVVTRAGDGYVGISNIGGVLRAGETLATPIDPEDFAGSTVCGVAIYSDREGSLDKPIYSFQFPDIPLEPDEEEIKSLRDKVMQAQAEMERQNKIAKPGGCFVLTACYGSYDAPTVLAFRQFRDNHLEQYWLGRQFINWYYTHGPKLAEFVEDKPRLRAASRSFFNQLAKILPR